MRRFQKVFNAPSLWKRNLNYMAYPIQNSTLKYFNDSKHTWLVEYGIGCNDLRKLQLVLSEVGRFKDIQQILGYQILSEIQLKALLDYVHNSYKNSKTTDLTKLSTTPSINQIYPCVGIDLSPTEIAFCSVDAYLNVTAMQYIPLDINLSNLDHVTKEICNVVDKLLPAADLYIIEKQPTLVQQISKDTTFLNFYVMEQLLHGAIATRKASHYHEQSSPKIITMSEKEMCLHTGLPNMQSQRDYICKVVTDDTFYYAEVIRSVNLMKLNEKRHVDLESMYDARNISSQYLVDVYFEILLKENVTLTEFHAFVNKFNIPDHLKMYYSSLPIKHDVGDALWLAASYWFYMSKNHPSFFQSLPSPNAITMITTAANE